ncbi:uncharacterized protein LACBIDRAFT_327705 [Laccaria bicolor S238N-H82]|uniref:Predicted protein n=1 Tax=Laccaria bicolor (strain S238N-H82 / ATCC MYA-4686) TaxID=486041 RepID=B0DCL4_LACBS|nr:uncharacterized protein LACBIDRAFT_327705 [Laccaria bicolor S238N-H82]EDR07752.1 predicted protein [Laccaria bicolor S238N-H82]|eukprot:XP_001881541.1 predicted protein [Laccaria bicolor S238N-H82]
MLLTMCLAFSFPGCSAVCELVDLTLTMPLTMCLALSFPGHRQSHPIRMCLLMTLTMLLTMCLAFSFPCDKVIQCKVCELVDLTLTASCVLLSHFMLYCTVYINFTGFPDVLVFTCYLILNLSLVFAGLVQSGFLPQKQATVDCNRSRTDPDVEGTELDHVGPVFCGPWTALKPIQTGFFA